MMPYNQWFYCNPIGYPGENSKNNFQTNIIVLEK